MSSSPKNVAVILPAAGSGRRFGQDENKLFALLAGRPIWLVAAERLRAHRRVARIVMPISDQDRPRFEGEFASQVDALGIELACGGAERTDSVRAGVDRVAGDAAVQLIAIHDAARPLVRSADLDAVFAKADHTGAAILATPVTATVKQSLDAGASCRTIDRSTLWLAQTPQVFALDVLQRAYAKHRGRPATDDAELVGRIGVHVALVPGSPDNLKITHPNDLIVAEAILKTQHESNHA
ncbi:2-C-methyl-D-erythritol 4-phosphate cytidylyltransferase [Stieleria neptunia]|uniref:2-C-methyl-D-erythritol 4-phosphate cytidylyltransferase n=1 Tax=Stieleria neptunia TaxID=2527979 RepID=A0A518HWN5_9BACT|nr:2-C-methyl-D-erythritol 4-phosphate cytidylyltransferase [Stieleria neptunia]QDV45174.1 2-C-methyl-D-erythritol 4-phosphate cytidylyltransferase [Stieleria neptunia]